MKAPFVPSWLDDLKLSLRQFRVYCHLWRRGESYSTAATIGTICGIKRETVFAILAELEARGLIAQEKRPGQTTLIRPVTPTVTGSASNPSPLPGPPPSPLVALVESPLLALHPSPLPGPKGVPIKEIPKRKSHKGAARSPKLSDEAFIDSLKSNEAFAGINIDHEIGKMKAWLLTKPGRQLTRPFMVNWLNRCDRPMKTTTATTTPRPSDETIHGRAGTFHPVE